MKIKHLYITLLAALVLGMNTGCEDRLNIAKHGSLGGPEDYYQTDSEAESAVASMYITWRNMYFNWYSLKNALADDVWAGGGSRGDSSELEGLNEYTYDSSNGFIKNVYQNLYSLIYKANLIIENVPGTTDVMKQAIAEAKAVRAWAQMELVSLWGTAPVVDHVLAVSEYHQSNGTPEQSWAFVESNLTEAIESGALPSKTSVNDQETGIRITQETAKALLGKAYLFQGKYTEAGEVLDEVIESKLYELYPDYEYLLHARANNSCEAMLELQMRNDAEQSWAQGNYSNSVEVMTGWRSAQLTFTSEASSVFAMGCYGFYSPRQTLYQAFVDREGENGYRLKSTMRTYAQMQEAGVSIASGQTLMGNEGYFMWKIRPLQEDLVINNPGWQVLQYVNHRIMRYAEVLLMAAEAHVMGDGDNAKATKYVNEIRRRAQLSDLASVTLDDVKAEKRLELCMECIRYQDLVRWGDAETMMAEQGKQVATYNGAAVQYPYTNTVYGFKAKHKLLPFPLTEMEVNSNMVQNEGW